MKKNLLFFICLLFLSAGRLLSQLSSPILVLPPENETHVSQTVTLDWQDVAGATGYFVETATDPNQILTGIQADSTNAATSQFTYSNGALISNTNYYWRVTARNSSGLGTPSDIRHFRTAGTSSQETTNEEADVTNLVNTNALSAVQGNILNAMLESARHQIDMNHPILAIVGLVFVDIRLFILRISGMISAANQQMLQNETDYIIAAIRQGDNIPAGAENEYLKEKTFSLKQNYPNPFNPSTTIEYSVPSNSFVSLKVYDIQGREVATVINKQQDAGSYITTWNASNVSSGVYFYKLTAGSYTQTKKMLLSK